MKFGSSYQICLKYIPWPNNSLLLDSSIQVHFQKQAMINAQEHLLLIIAKKLKWPEYSIRDLGYNKILYTFFFTVGSCWLSVLNIAVCVQHFERKNQIYVYTHIHKKRLSWYVVGKKAGCTKTCVADPLVYTCTYTVKFWKGI